MKFLSGFIRKLPYSWDVGKLSPDIVICHLECQAYLRSTILCMFWPKILFVLIFWSEFSISVSLIR